MSITKLLFIVVLLGGSFLPPAFAEPVADKDIKAGLVGSWVDPPQSEKDSLLRARQVFNDDGTTFVYLYATADCREPVAVIRAKWSVANGMLITQVTGTTHPGLIAIGQIEQVDVVAMESHRIVLNAEDKFYVREKSDTCFHPDARRT